MLVFFEAISPFINAVIVLYCKAFIKSFGELQYDQK